MRTFILSLFILMAFSHVGAKSIVQNKIDYVKNEGQWEAPILYKADLSGGWVFLEKNKLTYKFIDAAHLHHSGKQQHSKEEKIKGHAYEVKWLNANTNVVISSSDNRNYYNNYFIGKDSKKWKSNVRIFGSVLYQNIYPNIDFKVYGDANALKTDYIVHKNGNVQNLQFQYNGVDALSITTDGRLMIKTSINTIYELKPYAYQNINGKQYEVPCKYILNGNVLSFSLPNAYNKNEDLIIDPTLVFSTYSGSFSDNWGSSATHDNAGNMFLGGIALGAAYPTSLGAFQTSFNGGDGAEPTDIAITKFNATGTAKIYSTYLGGSSNELLASLYCTSNNDLIAVLATSSMDFPTTANAYNKTYNGGNFTFAMSNSILYPNGSDIAITKLNAAGSALVGSTFFGGSGNDGLNASASTNYNYGDDSRSDIAVDELGDIYITSTTNSTDILGTAGKAQANNGGGFDGVLAKFNADLSSLKWATYYGGSGDDASYSIGMDKQKNIFICGGTTSTDLPHTNNGLNTSYRGGDADGFVASFDNNGNAVQAASYIGTDGYDQAFILDLDLDDNIFLFGQTLGAYPVSNGVYNNVGAPQFIHKLNNTINTTVFSTVFGTENAQHINITPTALLVDVCNNIYAVGWGGFINNYGNTFDMPVTPDAAMDSTDGSDFYLISLNTNAANLVYATYFGETGGIGDHVDGGTSRFDKNGIVYQAVCASCAGTNEFPTTAGVIGPNNNADNCNMAGFKFDFKLTGLQIITTTATPSKGCQPLTTQFSYTSTQPGNEWHWDFGDGSTSTAQYPTHIYSNTGTYTVHFYLKDSTNCNPIDSSTITVEVGLPKTASIQEQICEGDSITIGHETFYTNGTYQITLMSVAGCDSIVTLHLTTIPLKHTSIQKAICSGQSYTFGNHTYTQSGIYTDTVQSNSGCDSIITLQLTVTDTIQSIIQQTICKGDFVNIGNQSFTENGIYTVHIPASGGCDSMIQLILQVIDTVKVQMNAAICSGDSLIIGYQILKETGNYTIHLKTSIGCDSLINITLRTIPIKEETLSRTICQGETIQIGNQTFSQAGSYEIKLTSAENCDSIVHLNLTVNPLPIIDATADKSQALPNEDIQLNVISNETLSYHWSPSDLLNNAHIQNPIAQIQATTLFTVVATNQRTNCSNSDSVLVNIQYLPCTNMYIYIPNAFTPNNDGNNDVLYVRSENLKEMHIEIFDRWGLKVFESNSINDGWDGTYKGSALPAEVYGYYFKGTCLEGKNIVLKGNITLLR